MKNLLEIGQQFNIKQTPICIYKTNLSCRDINTSKSAGKNAIKTQIWNRFYCKKCTLKRN